MELMDLPPELLFRIAIDVNLTNLLPLSQTSHFWATLLSDSRYWRDKSRYTYGQISPEPEDWRQFYRFHCRIWGCGLDVNTKFVRMIPYRAKFVSAGFESDGFIDLQGNIQVLGSNMFGELSQGDFEQRDEATPILFDGSPLKAKYISTGGRHSLTIGLDDKVWSFGANGEGQLGIGHDEETKGPICLGMEAILVSAGLFHSALIDPEGCVWIWGQNLNGNLGLGHQNKVMAPVSLGKRAQQICCGDGYTLILDLEGVLWGCGTNVHGQLGLGHFESVNEWKRVPDHKFKRISTKSYHSLGIDLQGRIWGWGQNDVGQLGVLNQGKISLPVLTGMTGQDISCGQVHSMILDMDRRIWVCGGNYNGQLGVGDTRHKSVPQKVMLHSAKMISAGSNHSYFLQQ